MMLSIHAAVGISTSFLFSKKLDPEPDKIKVFITDLTNKQTGIIGNKQRHQMSIGVFHPVCQQ